MNEPHFLHAVEACLENSDRLLLDAQMLEFSEPPATAFALIIIAQEELAKAFLLELVYKGIIQWNELIWRAARDHKCKHLLVLVLDFMSPEWDEFIARDGAWYTDRAKGLLPRKVADALNIFRHEKIGRWESRNWFWVDPPNYDPEAKKIGNGSVDKWKQDQLYIPIGKSGAVIPKRVISQEKFKAEMDRARRLFFLVKNIIEEECTHHFDYKLVKEAFQMLFENIKLDHEKKP
jgi:AbiV family abortive infection protein